MDLAIILTVVACSVGFFVTIGVLGSRAMARASQRDLRERVLATGVSAHATILKVVETGPSYNRVPHLLFTLRVEWSGEPFEATAKAFFRQIDYPRLQPGMHVEVKLDPATREVALVGDIV